MVNVRGNTGVVLKEIFNFSKGYAVFLALGPITTVPLYAAKNHVIHAFSIYLCIFFSRLISKNPSEKAFFFWGGQKPRLGLLQIAIKLIGASLAFAELVG